ncbi:SDR family oxidoreductase [Pelagibius marinus]|uniref:SDR family oxidoreductase n=1 Tax=Pelagibius marinus TaxID=2762760 RepID=UPI001872C2C2|nr:SDR family oxidoreductase [Pelagibius marinus]
MAKTALVTGASSGIGKAAALALAKAGYKVAICARREEALKETAAEAGGDMLAIPCDVSNPDSVAAMFAKIESEFGRLDVIFNNAGTNVPATNFGDLEWSAWKKVIDVNLNGMFLCASGAFKLMQRQKPQGGRIINNGSISAHVPRPGSAPYTSSKHAITGLTRSISLDGRPYDIACGQIDIGNAASHMTEAMSAGVPQADGSMKPEPTMDVAHVADAIVHMAGLPLEANVQFITIMSTKMPFIGRG